MDPITALGIAANVAQFLDFGSRLVSLTKEVAGEGVTVDVAHLSIITSDLVDINISIQRELQPASTNPANKPIPEEEALYDLAKQCNEVAMKLIACLQSVTSQGNSNRIWQSVWQALRTIWNKDELDGLARKLVEYREQLSLRILLLLNSHRAEQNDRLDAVQKRNEEIIEVLSINSRYLRSIMAGNESTHTNAEQRHEETMAAILTSRNGTSRTVTAPNYSESFKLSNSSGITTYKQHSEIQQGPSQQAANFETTEFTSFTKTILDALHFRAVNARRTAIPPAHQKTFQWAFNGSMGSTKRWDSLHDWLRGGSGCYWINGKAGSGKSTLMKFLHESSETTRLLKAWAGGSELIVASFFFWYAGTSLQKSQAGMLRSLLLEVLTRRPFLIPVLFPDVCRSILSKQLSGPIELSFSELLKAFSTFVASVSNGVKVCFIIDGLDEYDGDPNELAELLSGSTNSHSVKILLSSRPIPACVQAFSNCPSLRLQDLTHKDVVHYVEEKLGRHRLMLGLEMNEPGSTKQLVNAISSKASGVLLWVVLAVRSLIGGLQDYDTTPDLLQKLEELPPDLEKLYDHMLGSMNPRNRCQGSKLLQLVLRSTEIHEDYPMTLLQLSFAEDADYKRTIDSPVIVLSVDQEHRRCEATEGRMRSRCCGLIEVQNSVPLNDVSTASSTVGFLHRTVVEYLRTDTIWPKLVSLTATTNFDVYEALLSSCLAEVKSKPPLPEHKGDLYPAFNAMLRMLYYDRNTQDSKEIFWRRYLPALRTVIGAYWHDAALFQSPELQTQAVEDAISRANNRMGLTPSLSMMLFAASQCSRAQLSQLLQWRVGSQLQHESNPDIRKKILNRSLQAYLLTLYMDEGQVPYRVLLSKHIAGNNADPNVPIEVDRKNLWDWRWKDALPNQGSNKGWTLWEASLHYCHEIASSPPYGLHQLLHTGVAVSFLNILISFIEAGAKAAHHITVTQKVNSGRQECIEMSALEVLYRLLAQIWQERNPKRPPERARGRAEISQAINTIAEKACQVEAMLRSKGGSRWITTEEGHETESKQHARQKALSKVHKLRSWKQSKSSTPADKQASNSGSETPVDSQVTSKSGRKMVTRRSTEQNSESPWATHRSAQRRIADSHEASTTLSQSTTPTRTEDRVQITSIPDEPLSDTEELAELMGRTDLSAKDKRALFSRLSKKPLDEQAKILSRKKSRRKVMRQPLTPSE